MGGGVSANRILLFLSFCVRRFGFVYKQASLVYVYGCHLKMPLFLRLFLSNVSHPHAFPSSTHDYSLSVHYMQSWRTTKWTEPLTWKYTKGRKSMQALKTSLLHQSGRWSTIATIKSKLNELRLSPSAAKYLPLFPLHALWYCKSKCYCQYMPTLLYLAWLLVIVHQHA